jgi:hypothetical protein
LVIASESEAEGVPTLVAGKVSVAGEKVTLGVPAPAPVPVRAMLWGEPGTLSVMVTVAASAPIAAGVKPKVNTQLEPAASEVPQALVIVKLVVALRVMLLKLIGVLPAFESVTGIAVAAVPTACEPKVTVALENVSAVTLGVAVEPPPPQPAMRMKQKAMTGSERRLRSMDDPWIPAALVKPSL